MERKKETTKRTNAILASAVALVLVLGVLLASAPATRAAGPCKELAYANNQEFCIFVAKIIAHPHAGLLANAEPLYIAAYFPLPASCDITNQSTCHPETLPSGYQPLCNPCFHGGGLNNFPYHDHVISGAPGFGHNGTAGVMKGPWVLIIVAYTTAFSSQSNFVPFKSTSEILTGEAGGEFQSINSGGSNPFEINTGVVIIFGVQPLGD